MKVLFVCTGNTCRSPLAEAIARRMAAERGLLNQGEHGITFGSAGTNAFDGAAASEGSVLVAIERGLDLSQHRSRLLTSGIVDDRTLILGLADSHVYAARQIVPEANIYLLDEYASYGTSSRSVSDPFGGDISMYREAADEIEIMVAGMLNRLIAEELSQTS